MAPAVGNYTAHPEAVRRTSPHSISARPVDLVYLARYSLGNSAFESQILELFRTQSRIYLERLKKAAVGSRMWLVAAHTIKLSARDIGAWRLAKIAETAEALKGDALAVSRDDIISSLERHIGETNYFIRALLNGDRH
jgi:hypothetical protein